MAAKTPIYASLAVLFLINVLNFYDRNVGNALTEPLKHEFKLSDQEIGFMGSAFIWLYAIVGVPLGRLADHSNRKYILVGGVLVWSLLTAMNSFAQTYTHLILARLGVAVGEAVVAPTATSWIGDLFPADKRARALAIFMLGVPLGGALSYMLSGPVAQAFGWRIAMVIAAVPALFLAPALLFLEEPKRGAMEAHGHSTAAGESMWSVLRIPTMWWIIASGALLNFNMYAIHSFLPSLLIRVHGLSLAQAGIGVGTIMAIGGLSGALLAANLGDRVIRTHQNGRLMLAAVFAVLGAPAAYLGIVQPNGSIWVASVFMVLAYASCNSYYGLVYSSIQDIVAPRQRASTMSIYFMAMYLCGASLGPLLTGTLSDWRARVAAQTAGSAVITAQHRAIGLQEAMLVVPVLLLLLGAVLYAGSRTVAADMGKRQLELAGVPAVVG